MQKLVLVFTLSVLILFTFADAQQVFADEHDVEEKKGKKSPKTLEEACAKELDKKKLKLEGFICQALLSQQGTIEDTNSKVDQLLLLLSSPVVDISEIKNEVQNLKTQLTNVQTTLDDGLPAIQTEILSLDLSGIAAIQNILDDPNDDPAEPNNIQMIKDDIATLNLSAQPYTLELEYIVSALSEDNRRNIVLGVFSECDEPDNCPFTVDSIFLRPEQFPHISRPSVILVCSDDLTTNDIAPNCMATLAGGGSFGVGTSGGLSFSGETHPDAPKLTGATDVGIDFGTTLPFGFNHPVWAKPNMPIDVTGNEVLGSSGVGSVNAKKFVTVLLIDFSGKIVINGQRDPGVEVKSVIMNSLEQFEPTEGTSGGECGSTCKDIMKSSCFGTCGPAGTSVSLDSQPGEYPIRNVVFSQSGDTPIRTIVYTQNENQRSNTIPIVTQSPQFGSNNNQFTDPPKLVAFGELSLGPVDALIQKHLQEATSQIDLTDVIDSVNIENELTTVTADFGEILLSLGFPDPIAEITAVINKIDTATTGLVTTIDDNVVAPITGLVTDITLVTEDTAAIKSGVNVAFGSINDDLIAKLNNLKFTVPIEDPKFKIPDPELHTKSINPCKALGGDCSFEIPNGFHVHAKTKTFPILDPEIDLSLAIPPISTIP